MTQENKLIDNFFEKSTVVPTMEKKRRTKAESDKIKSNQNWFFSAIWFFLAVTTFLFGYQNLDSLFVYLIDWLPFAPSTVQTVAAWLGGIMGIMFLDGGYKLWGYVALNSSETAGQLQVARTAEIVAFVGSAYFTGAVIISAFSSVIAPVIIWLLEVFGVVVFVGSALTTMISMFLFLRWSMEATKLAHDAEATSEETTEILDLYKTAKRDAVTLAAEAMKAKMSDISAGMADQLAASIEREMKSQLTPTDEKKTGKN